MSFNTFIIVWIIITTTKGIEIKKLIAKIPTDELKHFSLLLTIDIIKRPKDTNVSITWLKILIMQIAIKGSLAFLLKDLYPNMIWKSKGANNRIIE